MEQTIASYLFLHKECILPGIGTLKMTTNPSESKYASQEIKAPVQRITFVADERTPTVANDLITASQLLKINLDNNGTALLKSIGTFTRDKDGIVRFSPIVLNNAYTPTLKVATLITQKKLVRKEVAHKQRWGLWAAMLAVLAAILILVYCTSNNANSAVPFGNSSTISPTTSGSQYRDVK
jgi:hypothetical protein